MAGVDNLCPAKPGEVRNPEGRNQFTYRREAEKHLEEWCKQYGRELIFKVANDAKAGKPWAAKLLLDRVLPAVTKHEVDVPGVDVLGLADALATAAKSRRSNGRDQEADTGANGGSS